MPAKNHHQMQDALDVGLQHKHMSIRLSNMSAAYMSTSETEAVNYYHKALHLRCCSSSRSASENQRNGVKLEFQTNYNSRQCV